MTNNKKKQKSVLKKISWEKSYPNKNFTQNKGKDKIISEKLHRKNGFYDEEEFLPKLFDQQKLVLSKTTKL